MERLTPKTAESFAKKCFNAKLKGFERKFIILHSCSVLKTSLKLAKGKKVNLNSLKIASWLHDIGRTVNIEQHAAISVEIAQKEFGKLNDTIKDCILNHGRKGNPKTKEGKIIQLADKLSIITDYDLIKLLFSKEKYKKKSADFMNRVCSDLIKALENYEW